MNSNLAIFGGAKAVQALKKYNTIGEEECIAAKKVIESGVLSSYLGDWSPDFFGGEQVQKFEEECATFFGVKFAVTVNSWTSGLVAAIGAIGIEPGDEVIVSPWTMCATATAILHWNAIPIFADIEDKTFCLDPDSVESRITSKTKAILAVDIFGHSANMNALNLLAKKHNLKIISDTAQSPGALYQEKFAGTIADVGGFSLNYHKHIHTGEGGILVTNDPVIAERLQLIRNHAEAVVEKKGVKNLVNMLGHNFRLGEIECAIGREQLKKLSKNILGRQKAANRLIDGLSNLSGIRLPIVEADCTHVFYSFPMVLDIEMLEVSRDLIHKALTAEGVPVAQGYQNIHLLPMYQHKIAYGSKGFPWTAEFTRKDISYAKGICPVAEKLHDESFLGMGICSFDLSNQEVDALIEGFQKVWANLDALRKIQTA